MASLVTDATGTDLCYVYVLDDSGRTLTLAGAAPPLEAEIGRIGLPLGTGVSGWVASHQQPAVITDEKEADRGTATCPSCAAGTSPRWPRFP